MELTDLRGKENLYAALMTLARQRPEITLPDVYAALGEGRDSDRLKAVDQGLLRAVLSYGRDGSAVPGHDAVIAWLRAAKVASLFDPGIESAGSIGLLTRGERPDMPAFSDRAFDVWFNAQGVAYGMGSYGEKRTVYASDQFADAASPERRCLHLGIDVFAAVFTPVHAPLDGVVEVVAYNADPLDYGHTLILRHQAGDRAFWTLYGHLSQSLAGLCRPGQTVRAGAVIAHLGDWHENGGWAPHLHFQIITDRLATGGNFFGVGHESLWPVWQQISPDPNLILRLPARSFQV